MSLQFLVFSISQIYKYLSLPLFASSFIVFSFSSHLSHSLSPRLCIWIPVLVDSEKVYAKICTISSAVRSQSVDMFDCFEKFLKQMGGNRMSIYIL